MSNPVLVDAEWLLAHQDDANVVIIEVDEDTAIYELNHIRNAIRLDWKKDLQDQVRRDFVNQEQFSALLSARGVNTVDIVVLYGASRGRRRRPCQTPARDCAAADARRARVLTRRRRTAIEG